MEQTFESEEVRKETNKKEAFKQNNIPFLNINFTNYSITISAFAEKELLVLKHLDYVGFSTAKVEDKKIWFIYKSDENNKNAYQVKRSRFNRPLRISNKALVKEMIEKDSFDKIAASEFVDLKSLRLGMSLFPTKLLIKGETETKELYGFKLYELNDKP